MGANKMKSSSWTTQPYFAPSVRLNYTNWIVFEFTYDFAIAGLRDLTLEAVNLHILFVAVWITEYKDKQIGMWGLYYCSSAAKGYFRWAWTSRAVDRRQPQSFRNSNLNCNIATVLFWYDANFGVIPSHRLSLSRITVIFNFWNRYGTRARGQLLRFWDGF